MEPPLCRNNDFRSRITEGVGKKRLRLAKPVDVGGIKECDARLICLTNGCLDLRDIDGSPIHSPEWLTAECDP